MNRPLLSICIPTFNRSQFLTFLLERLSRDLGSIDFNYEIIICDNASMDKTKDVVADASVFFGNKLRYFRHETNIGAVNNVQFSYSVANGAYCIYLADDDILIWHRVFEVLTLLLENPKVVVLYAPWIMVDLVDDITGGQFYYHENSSYFKSYDIYKMVHFILENRIFPEICIIKTDIIKRVLPASSDIAFWAFTHPAEFLRFGDIIFAAQPFYGSVTRHPASLERSQEGTAETMIGWDRYRGGVEHLIGLARDSASHEQISELVSLGNDLVYERMLVALRLRLAQGKDLVDSFFLASRLRGLGLVNSLPVDFNELKLKAAIWFLATKVANFYDVNKIILFGAFDNSVFNFIRSISPLPVLRFSDEMAITKQDIVLTLGVSDLNSLPLNLFNSGFLTSDTILFQKFS